MAMSLGMAAIVTVTFADGTSYSGSMINSKLTYGLDRRLEMDCYFFADQVAKIDLDKPSSPPADPPADPPVKSKSVAPKATSPGHAIPDVGLWLDTCTPEERELYRSECHAIRMYLDNIGREIGVKLVVANAPIDVSP